MSESAHCKKPAEHQQHLCYLKSRLPKTELSPLLKNPRYVCGICGGKVNGGRNLCDPRRIRT